MKKVIGKKIKEELFHFKCARCKKWWAIGDAAKNKKFWFCPWCGTKQEIK